MRWGVLFAIGAAGALAVTQPKAAVGLLAFAMLTIAVSMMVVAWSYFRLSRINTGQIRTPWPPPPPPVTEQPLQGPPVEWFRGQPLTGWRSWWPRTRERFGAAAAESDDHSPSSGEASQPPVARTAERVDASD
jgi:hypothetical protein